MNQKKSRFCILGVMVFSLMIQSLGILAVPQFEHAEENAIKMIDTIIEGESSLEEMPREAIPREAIPVEAIPTEGQPKANVDITARSFVLMEALSGKVLASRDQDLVLPPASITKVMTLLLIHEAIDSGKINWDDKVTISEHAAHMGGSQVFMEPGEEQTVRELVKCIAIASANDAAVAMSEYIGGSEAQFVELMNKRAAELGMTHTVFKNACGLHTEGHVSTAYDVALMSRALITEHPELSNILLTWMDTITHKTRKGETQFGLTNTNKMIKWYNGITGLKTGYTPQAKHCVSATASRDGMNLIAVVMGATDGKIRFREAGQLLDYGFANYQVTTGPKIGTILENVAVKKGDQKEVGVTINKEMAYVVAKGKNGETIEYTLEYDQNLKAPIYKGQVIGTIVYTLKGIKIGEGQLVAASDVGKAKLKNMLPYMCKQFFRIEK